MNWLQTWPYVCILPAWQSSAYALRPPLGDPPQGDHPLSIVPHVLVSPSAPPWQLIHYNSALCTVPFRRLARTCVAWWWSVCVRVCAAARACVQWRVNWWTIDCHAGESAAVLHLSVIMSAIAYSHNSFPRHPNLYARVSTFQSAHSPLICAISSLCVQIWSEIPQLLTKQNHGSVCLCWLVSPWVFSQWAGVGVSSLPVLSLLCLSCLVRLVFCVFGCKLRHLSCVCTRGYRLQRL